MSGGVSSPRTELALPGARRFCIVILLDARVWRELARTR